MNIFTKTKASSILNVLGMTIAFAAFYVIMSQVQYDLTYNKGIKDKNNAYIMCLSYDEIDWSTVIPIQVSRRTAEGVPGAQIGFFNIRRGAEDVYVWEGAGSRRYRIGVHYFTKSGADVLDVNFISGSYPQPNSGVAISEKAAQMMSVSSGDVIWIFDPLKNEKVSATVSGVFESFAENTDFHDLDILWDQETIIMTQPDNNMSFNGLVRFASIDDVEKFEELFKKYDYESCMDMIGQYGIAPEQQEAVLAQLLHHEKLISLNDIHFSNVNDYTNTRTTRSSVYVLIAIAFIIIIIAFINFVNFFVSLVPEKMKSVNIRKVFGASRGVLIWSFIKEALEYVGVAIALSIVLVLAISKSPVGDLTDGGLGLGSNMLAFAVLVLVSVAFAALSALFPAMYVTNVTVAMGVKSGFSRSVAGKAIRKVLITMQLGVAVSMMIISTIFYMQYRLMTTKELGFDKENLYEMSVPSYTPSVKSRLEGISGVKGVTACNNQITGNAGMQQTMSNNKNSTKLTLMIRKVLPNYLDVVGIPLLEGEGFTESNSGKMVLDIASKERWEAFNEGHDENAYTSVSGYCAETKSKPATDKTNDGIEAYRNVGYDGNGLTYLIFRTEKGVDTKNIIRQVVDAVCAEYDLYEAPDVRSVDDELAERYEKFRTQSVIIGMFSLIAIIIALMGVFGIVLFETEHRRHETAVRKVLGAEGNDIVSLFCKQYVVTVIIACLLATPVAIYVTREWLEQFTTQVTVSPWLYFAAFAIVAILTLGIIIFRTISVAKENPVNNLKSE